MIVLMGMSNLGIMVLMVHVHDSKSRSILEIIDIVIMDLCGVVFFLHFVLWLSVGLCALWIWVVCCVWFVFLAGFVRLSHLFTKFMF